MSLISELIEELHTSLRDIDGNNLTPPLALARAARIVDLLQTAPRNRALFLTVAAMALAGAQACKGNRSCGA